MEWGGLEGSIETRQVTGPRRLSHLSLPGPILYVEYDYTR